MAGDTPANRAEQSFSFTPQVARGRAKSRGDFRLRQFGMHTTRRFLFAAETAASRLVAAGFHVPATFIAPFRDALPQLDNLTYFRNPRLSAPVKLASQRFVRRYVRFAHTHGLTPVARLNFSFHYRLPLIDGKQSFSRELTFPARLTLRINSSLLPPNS